jgi:hypothetical protein
MAFGATIDVFHAEIAAAISHGDDRAIANIAKAFCERCHYWRPWKVVGLRSHVCPMDGLQALVDIEFASGTPATVCAGYRNGKRRLTVNGEDVRCESAADVVHVLEVPCSFFDGIYYAIEGLEVIARGKLQEQIAERDSQAKDAESRVATSYALLERVDKQLRAASGQLAAVHQRLGQAIDACEIAENTKAFTIRPLDWRDRLLDAGSMVHVPASEFFSVMDAKEKLSGKSGVYFGWRISDGRCVYVGKSINLGTRINPSRAELVDCKITVIEMPESEIHTWELFYIWLHRPERNIEVRLSSKLPASNNSAGVCCG